MIRIERLQFAVGDFALHDVALQVEEGEYVVLLGKPGSGKTLLLECLAGLRRISAGTIAIGDRRVDQLEPADRGIGYVPQDYALFSTRTVRDNIAFGLRARRVPREQREQRVSELGEMLGISYLLGRRTHGLSGGERQRVALARALAPWPKTLLLDEPVSALDEETRDEILFELRGVQRQTGTTTVHVCHDLDEMRSVADRVAILSRGRLVQTGRPDEIRQHPASAEVARLLRLGTVLEGVARVEQCCCRINLGDFGVLAPGQFDGAVDVLIRPNGVRLTTASCCQCGLRGRVQAVLRRETTARVRLQIGSTCLSAEVPRSESESLSLEPGAEVGVVVPPQAVHVLPEGDEQSSPPHR